MSLEMMQDVLKAKKQVDEMFGGREKRGSENMARLAYKDAHTYLDMLAKGEISGEQVQEVAQKALSALIEYGNAVNAATGSHPANR